jgi:hypothetical protein
VSTITSARCVHLVGSLPFESAEEALRRCGEGLGEMVTSLPDGETGERKMWVNYLPEQIYTSHPDLEETHRPDPEAFEAPEHPDPDSPPAMDDPEAQWLFRTKPGTTDLRFELGYARFALESYEVSRGCERTAPSRRTSRSRCAFRRR